MKRTKRQEKSISLLLSYRRDVQRLQRQVTRLLSSDPIKAAEAEVARLEQRCIDIENLYEQAEGECYDLRKALGLERRAS